MGERIRHDASISDATIINFPVTYYDLEPLDSSEMGDIELQNALDRDISRSLIVKQGRRDGVLFVLNGVLEAARITRPVSELIGADRKVRRGMDADAMRVKEIHNQIMQARVWFDDRLKSARIIEVSEELEDLQSAVSEIWQETNFFRAFNHLRKRVEANMTDAAQKAPIIEAHRLAIIMMAQATEAKNV